MLDKVTKRNYYVTISNNKEIESEVNGMLSEEKKDLQNLVKTLSKLDNTQRMLVQNSANTLLMYQKMVGSSAETKRKQELVQQ